MTTKVIDNCSSDALLDMFNPNWSKKAKRVTKIKTPKIIKRKEPKLFKRTAVDVRWIDSQEEFLAIIDDKYFEIKH